MDDPGPLDECTSVQRDILILTAAEGPMSGSELLDAVHELYQLPDQRVAESSLYHHLDSLLGEGFLEKCERDGRTNEYRLTRRARRRLVGYRRWVSQSLDDLAV